VDDNIPGFGALRLKYLDQLAERQLVVSEKLTALKSIDRAEARQNLWDAHEFLHQISGSAGSFGFHALGEAARVCDAHIAGHLHQTDAMTPDAIAVALDLLAAFEAECTAALA